MTRFDLAAAWAASLNQLTQNQPTSNAAVLETVQVRVASYI